MLYNRHFYHQLMKKYSLVLGAVFSDIDVVRYTSTGAEDHRIKVGVTHSNKEKWVRRIYEDPELLSKSGITLPRIGYSLVSMQYSPTRKLSSKLRFIIRTPGNSLVANKVMMPVPYDFIYSATIVAKTQEDLYQILEQITPFFTPDLNFTMKGIQNPELKFDVPINLVGVQIDDEYDGELDDRRILMAELTFVVKGYLFGPVREGTKTVGSVDIGLDINQLPGGLRNVFIDIGVTPFLEDTPIGEINPDGSFSFTDTITEKYACSDPVIEEEE